MTQETIHPTNGECVAAGAEFARNNGEEAWNALCDSWGMDRNDSKREEIFVAGLAMGFVECLKIVRDTFADEDGLESEEAEQST